MGVGGGEEEMQFLRSAADSSDASAAVITPSMYASQEPRKKRTFELVQKQQRQNTLDVKWLGTVVDSENRFNYDY